MSLLPGLYDLLITESVARSLASADGLRSEVTSISPEDLPDRLASALGDQLRAILADVEEEPEGGASLAAAAAHLHTPATPGGSSAHVPRAQMTAEALAVWDRAVGDLRAAGAIVEPFTLPCDRLTYRDAFASASRARGDVAVDPDSPPPTASSSCAALTRPFPDSAAEPSPIAPDRRLPTLVNGLFGRESHAPGFAAEVRAAPSAYCVRSCTCRAHRSELPRHQRS